MDEQSLLTKLDSGNYSLVELPPDEQSFMAEVLRPTAEGFTDEQREYFENRYLLLPDDRVFELQSLQRSDRVASWRQTIDGRKLLSVSLLTDCREGETWYHLRSLLGTLKFVKVLPDAFPVETDW